MFTRAPVPEAFLALVGQRATVVASERVSENGRLLVWYERKRPALGPVDRDLPDRGLIS